MGLMKMDEKELLSASLISSVKLMMWPLLGLGLSIGVLMLLSQQGYSRVKNEIKRLEESKTMGSTLSEKLSVLENAKIEVNIHAESVSKALPGDNSSLIMFANVSKLAEENNVEIIKRKVDNLTQTEDLSNSMVILDIKSDNIENIINFTRGLTKVTPISTLSKFTLNSSSGLDSISADLEIAVYWSNFPVKISGILDPIAGLTLEDKGFISKVSVLEESDVYEVTPNTPTERDDPFN